jgi:arginine:ornithine antiporter/lysine permease
VLLAALLYAPGTWLYVQARSEQGRRVFTRREAAGFGLVCLAAAIALYALASGRMTF